MTDKEMKYESVDETSVQPAWWEHSTDLTVTSHPTKGRCVVAERNYYAGSTIMIETCMFHGSDDRNDKNSLYKLLENDERIKDLYMGACINNINKENDNHKICYPELVMEYNCFVASEDLTSDLGLHISFINHDCSPNAELVNYKLLSNQSISPTNTVDEKQMISKYYLSAKTAILKGTEVTISYLSNDELAKSKEERRQLLRHWCGANGCQCNTCSTP
jgi:hypothetical protein